MATVAPCDSGKTSYNSTCIDICDDGDLAIVVIFKGPT